MSESNKVSGPESLTSINPKLLIIGSTIPFQIYVKRGG